jgi:hypothetical protein
VACSADLYFCTPQEVPEIWKDVHDFLEEACKDSRQLGPRQLYDGLLLGRYTLCVAVKEKVIGCGVIQVGDDIYGAKACGILAGGGVVGRMKDWVPKWFDTIETLAREAGCKYTFMIGRKGWSRFGYKIIAYQMRKEL